MFLFKHIIKILLGDIVLFPIFLFNIFINIKKIRNCEVLVLQNSTGYGNHFTHQDLARYFFRNKKITYIHYFEKNRQNKFLPKVFDMSYFYFKNNISFELFNKRITFGEIESSKIKPLYNLSILLIKFFKKKESRIYLYPFIYEKINRSCKKFNLNFDLRDVDLNKDKHWISYYYFLVNKYKKKFLLNKIDPTSLDIKIENNRKICCIYLRYKNNNINDFNLMRSGHESIDEYLELIEFLISKNYFIGLIGDINEKSYKKIKKFNKNLINVCNLKGIHKLNTELYFLTNCDLFISEPGGCIYFGLYAKKTLLINYFPINYPFPALKLNKKVFNEDKNNYEDFNKLSYNKQINELLYNNKLKLKNNNSSEILNFVKNNI